MLTTDPKFYKIDIIPSNSNFQITIIGGQKHLELTCKLINLVSTQHGIKDMDADVIEMAILEACHNSLRYCSKEKGNLYFNLEFSIEENKVKAIISDKGEEYEIDDIEPFNVNQDFTIYKNGGLGIPLIKSLMDEVSYTRRSNNTNELTLVKYFQSIGKKKRNQAYED